MSTGPWKKKKKTRTRTLVKAVTEVFNGENPFEIKRDMEYTGNRSNPKLLDALAEQLIKLNPENRQESVNIPLTVCENRGAAGNLFLTIRRYFSDHKNKSYRNMHFTSRGVFSMDGKKTYLGSRIWRVK